jgi:hypothetical protein
MPNLWDVADLPDRQPVEKGWGQKVIAIWRWKNELPATYLEEIFYGKILPGRAVLMSMDYLRVEHYPKHHRPFTECSALARKIYERLRLDPLRASALRKALNMNLRPERDRFDRALQETEINLMGQDSNRSSAERVTCAGRGDEKTVIWRDASVRRRASRYRSALRFGSDSILAECCD